MSAPDLSSLSGYTSTGHVAAAAAGPGDSPPAPRPPPKTQSYSSSTGQSGSGGLPQYGAASNAPAHSLGQATTSPPNQSRSAPQNASSEVPAPRHPSNSSSSHAAPRRGSSSTGQRQDRQEQSQHPRPPDVADYWLPSQLQDKTTSQLSALLRAPPPETCPTSTETMNTSLPQKASTALLPSLAHTHPSLHPSASPLLPLLTQTSSLASHLSSRHAHLQRRRQHVEQHLLHLHALERQWRDKQAALDKQLDPFSAKSLYIRLREAEREGEEESVMLERSWLADGGGGARNSNGRRKVGDESSVRHSDGDGLEERDVQEWIRNYTALRRRVWMRRSWRERWDEGRVGGWR